MDKQVFVLLNDEIVKEFHNIYELLIDITVEELKNSGKAFFYPVMLIYTKDILYNNRIMRINTLNDSEYKDISAERTQRKISVLYNLFKFILLDFLNIYHTMIIFFHGPHTLF